MQDFLIYNNYDIHLLKFATHALHWKLRKDFLKPVRYGQSGQFYILILL